MGPIQVSKIFPSNAAAPGMHHMVGSVEQYLGIFGCWVSKRKMTPRDFRAVLVLLWKGLYYLLLLLLCMSQFKCMCWIHFTTKAHSCSLRRLIQKLKMYSELMAQKNKNTKEKQNHHCLYVKQSEEFLFYIMLLVELLANLFCEAKGHVHKWRIFGLCSIKQSGGINSK